MLVASTFVLGLLPPPALREGRHRGFARRLVAVRRRLSPTKSISEG